MKWKLGDAKWREAERHDVERCETERRKMEHCEAELYDAERRKMKDLMQTNDLTKMPCLLNSSLYQLHVSAFTPQRSPKAPSYLREPFFATKGYSTDQLRGEA